MSQKYYWTGHQVRPRLFLVSLATFSLLLFLAIGLIMLTLNKFQNFYERKRSDMNQTSIELVMADTPDAEKVVRCLRDAGYHNLSIQKALRMDNTAMQQQEGRRMNVLILDSTKNRIRYAKGNDEGEGAIVLPYVMHSVYDYELNQKIAFGERGKSPTYTITGFYEDEILSQQNPEDLLVVYMSPEYYQAIQRKGVGVDYLVGSIQLEGDAKVSEVMEQLEQKLKEQLYIGGLNLELYNCAVVSENVELYLQSVQKVCLLSGMLCVVAALVALVYIIRRETIEKSQEQVKTKILRTINGVLPVGVLLMLFWENHMISSIVGRCGYQRERSTVILDVIFSVLIYYLLQTIVIVVNVRKKSSKKQKNWGERNRIQIVKGMLPVFFTTLFLSIIAIPCGTIYGTTVGNENLCYNYAPDSDVIEVFQNTKESRAQQHMSSEITDYVQPLAKIFVICGLLAAGIVYSVSVGDGIHKQMQSLSVQGEQNLHIHALPVLGQVLCVTFIAMVCGLGISFLGMEPVLASVKDSFGILIPKTSPNVPWTVILYGGYMVLAGGVTLAELQQ